MIRPIGATVLSIVLALLSIAGLGNAYIMLTNPGYGTYLTATLAALYGVGALLSAATLWRMNKIAHKIFLSWAAIVVMLALSMWSYPPSFANIAFGLFLCTVLVLLARYVRKVLNSLTARLQQSRT